MTKWHARVARMAKHMNMVGGPGLLGPPLTPSLDVTMKFAQLHYFLSQKVGVDKRYYVPPYPKVGRDMSPPYTRSLPPTNEVLSRSVYSGCARCALHTLWNWTWRGIFQKVRSRWNHKKATKIIMYFLARTCAPWICSLLRSYSKR